MNEKREFQRSESFAAAALLALSGGLLDAYTYLCRGGVFANAQTGNMVLLAIRAAEGKWQEAGRYLIPILAFAACVMVAETVNVRKSASETADKIGVCYQGGELEILMQQADGWTRVRFEGQIGYVKTDVLKVME